MQVKPSSKMMLEIKFKTLPCLVSLIILFNIKFINSFQVQNYVIVIGCDYSKEQNSIPELYGSVPKIVVTCAIAHFHPNRPLPTTPRQHIRYGPQRHTHIFHHIQSSSQHLVQAWKEIYGLLTLTRYKSNFFHYSATYYTKYPGYNAATFLTDYWRSQWNQDYFVLNPITDTVLSSLLDYDQLPTHLQAQLNHPPSIHNFGALLYSALSGWGGSRCNFYTLEEQLYELTLTFNAFDMLFCEVFRFYNVSFQANYNFQDFFYMRGFLIRDDLISLFPSDANALFYASPGITFIVLKQAPVAWGNIVRPFQPKVWIGVFLCLVGIVGCNQLYWKVMGSNSHSFGDNLLKMRNPKAHPTTSHRFWLISVRFILFLLMSAYSGMILAGYLDPIYPWTPRTFTELNQTTNFIMAVPFDSAVERELLNSSSVLNGVQKSKWMDKVVNGTVIANPGDFLPLAESDLENRYALLMYSDKKNLYVSSRHQLGRTWKYVQDLQADNEVVLQEMRYCSVSPGATKLHFLVDALKRNFETGVWMRWKSLEDNYFKYVSMVARRKFVAVGEKGRWDDGRKVTRSLNVGDILVVLSVLGGGLSVGFVAFWMVERNLCGVC